MDSNGTQASVVHQVPFKPLRSGSVDLPKLKIQYFDPDTGRIETFYHQTDPPMAWNVPLIVTTVLVTLGLAVLGWRLVARRYIRYYARYRQKQIALQMVQQAKSAQEIFIGLRRYALAEGWPANLTISDYGIYWQQQYRVSADFGALLQRLSRTLYGGQSNYSLQELQQGLLQNLRKPQRRRQTSQSSNTVWNINYIFVPQKKAL